MSKYTTEVRYICESEAGLDSSKGYNDIDTIIANSRTKIFSFPYEIYDENYRSVLETKILKHYYTREIGLETYGLWKLKLDTKMNEIMPYYNQLYKSTLLEFNPLYTTDLHKEYDRRGAGESSGTNDTDSTRTIGTQETESRTDALDSTVTTSNSGTLNDTTSETNSGTVNDTTSETRSGTSNTTESGTSRNKYSDTPQGALTDLEADNYLTNARKITQDETIGVMTADTINGTLARMTSDTKSGTLGRMTTDSGSTITDSDLTSSKTLNRSTSDVLDERKTNSNEFSNTEAYLEYVYGFSNKDASELLLKYRKTFLNIDMMIINELEELFLHLW